MSPLADLHFVTKQALPSKGICAQALHWPCHCEHTIHEGVCAFAGAAEANGHAHVDSDGAAEANLALEPKSSQEWVELLVQQMAGAKDLDDARGRASQILQAFEQAVLRQASQVSTYPIPILQACRCEHSHMKRLYMQMSKS